mgnify:FL=1
MSMENMNDTSKIKAENLSKTTFVDNDDLNIFYVKGGSDTAYIRGLRMDSKSRRSMVAVGNTLTKGLWWKGTETKNSPKFFWYVAPKGNVQLFIGRLTVMMQTKRIESL